MKKPSKYTLIHRTTKEIKPWIGYTSAPLTHELMEYVDGVNTQVWDAYIDNRYAAKLRLYNYITFAKRGLSVPKYKPTKESITLP